MLVHSVIGSSEKQTTVALYGDEFFLFQLLDVCSAFNYEQPLVDFLIVPHCARDEVFVLHVVPQPEVLRLCELFESVFQRLVSRAVDSPYGFEQALSVVLECEMQCQCSFAAADGPMDCHFKVCSFFGTISQIEKPFTLLLIEFSSNKQFLASLLFNSIEVYISINSRNFFQLF